MNVLAIGAHFDDIELGCGGALSKHVANNDNVYVYVATTSGYSNPQGAVVRKDSLALQEGIDAIKILGATLIQGHFPTLQIEFDDDLNMEIVGLVEKYQIDLVYTHWNGDIHHDHKAVAYASLHSCRHVPRLLMYRSNWYHSTFDFRENFYVDITEHWENKKKIIEAHESEITRSGRKWVDFFHNEAKNAGQRIGVKYAEVFELVKWIV